MSPSPAGSTATQQSRPASLMRTMIARICRDVGRQPPPSMASLSRMVRSPAASRSSSLLSIVLRRSSTILWHQAWLQLSQRLTRFLPPTASCALPRPRLGRDLDRARLAAEHRQAVEVVQAAAVEADHDHLAALDDGVEVIALSARPFQNSAPAQLSDRAAMPGSTLRCLAKKPTSDFWPFAQGLVVLVEHELLVDRGAEVGVGM
jgi:hypothetical protein